MKAVMKLLVITHNTKLYKALEILPNNPVSKIIINHLLPILDHKVIASKIMDDVFEIEDFQTSNKGDFTGIHQFLINVIRYGISYAKIAKFLELNDAQQLVEYVNRNRSINLDFVRNPTLIMKVYPNEIEFIMGYIKTLYVDFKIPIHYSIWTAAKMFSYQTTDMLNLFVDGKLDYAPYQEIKKFISSISRNFGIGQYPDPNPELEHVLKNIMFPMSDVESVHIKGIPTPDDITGGVNSVIDVETPEPVVEEIPEPVVSKPEPVVPKLVSIDLNNEPRIKMFKEFRIHGCIYNDPPCLVNDLHVAFNAFAKQRNKNDIPITRDGFVHLLKKLGFTPKSDLDGKQYVENLAPFSNALITTSITLTQKQGVMSELFPNLSIDAIKLLVQAMTEANINTDIVMVPVGTGKVITFNPKTEEQLKAQNSE